jgi:hypothetical protein
MSLPLAFATTVGTIPAPVPYLRADAARLAEWRAKLGARREPRLGITWSGSETNPKLRNRSVPLAQFAPLLPDGWQIFGLQKEVRARDRQALKLAPQIRNLGSELRDFSDTAAACQCMDVIVSVDTSVAHLSAALGMETWILLPFSADWRWLLGRSDSPWYPTARLYRQDRRGEWNTVLARVSGDLQRRGAQHQLTGVTEPDPA